MEWVNLYRPRRWEDLLGQSSIKSVIQQSMSAGNFPRLTMFTGKSGTGKSSIAELCAMTLACENSKSEPCCICDSCRDFLNGTSRSIKKYNMASLLKKSDALSVMSSIFDYESLTGISIFILEEIHELSPESQAPFLEELTKIPEDTYIIMCTTKPFKIIEELRNRALVINLTQPTYTECVSFVSRICKSADVKVPDTATMKVLINTCEGNPRKLIETMQFFSSNNKISIEDLINFFGLISDKLFIDLLEQLQPSVQFTSYCMFLEELCSKTPATQIMKGLPDFCVELLLSRTNSVKFKLLGETDRLTIIVNSLGEQGILKLLNFVSEIEYSNYSSENKAKLCLLTLKQKLSPTTQTNMSIATTMKIQSENNSRILENKSNVVRKASELSPMVSKQFSSNGTAIFIEEDADDE